MPVSRAPVPLRASDAAIDRERFPSPPEVLAQAADPCKGQGRRFALMVAALLYGENRFRGFR